MCRVPKDRGDRVGWGDPYPQRQTSWLVKGSFPGRFNWRCLWMVCFRLVVGVNGVIVVERMGLSILLEEITLQVIKTVR